MIRHFFKKPAKQESKDINMFGLDYFMSYPSSGSDISNYKNNVIVHKCVNLVAATASHVPWNLYFKQGQKKEQYQHHPILQLFKSPNHIQTGADFFVELISNKLLFGNAYILGLTDESNRPKELHILQNNDVEVIIKNGKMLGYKHNISGSEKTYSINPLNNQCKILHIKNYNPYDKISGASSLQAASLSIEIHNLASNWNISLLKNGARPSGALIMKDGNSYLTDEQFARLQEQFRQKHIGSDKIGKPLLLEGGLDWKDMSVTPKDMDFIESKNNAAREIALAFGVPPQLLGIAGDNTYSNMREARLALWEETIIPLLDKISDAFSNYFSSFYNQEIILEFDRDEISALTGKREDIWARIESSDFITINEKRAFLGLPPIESGDNLK